MKIIHVLAGKANPETTMNGVNVVVDTYARMMFDAGCDVEVWGIANNPHTNLPNPKYPLYLFQHHHGWRARLDPALLRHLRRVDARSTVFHFYSGFVRSFAGLVRLVDAPRYFSMPQGVYSDACLDRRWWRKRMYFHLIEKRFLSQSRGLLLTQRTELSPRVAGTLRDVPQYVIPNGSTAVMEDCPAERENSRARRTVWGFCGRIDNAHKAVDKLVRCFLTLCRQRPREKHVLSLVGDGPDLPAIRDKYDREIRRGTIEIHGGLFGRAKREQLQRMHYFVHLSNWEGVPLACLEAAGMGIPLLVTPGTNLAEDVTRFRAGVATSADEEAVVQTMHSLVAAGYAELVNGCKRLVMEKYSWRASCDRLIELYEEAVRR